MEPTYTEAEGKRDKGISLPYRGWFKAAAFAFCVLAAVCALLSFLVEREWRSNGYYRISRAQTLSAAYYEQGREDCQFILEQLLLGQMPEVITETYAKSNLLSAAVEGLEEEDIIFSMDFGVDGADTVALVYGATFNQDPQGGIFMWPSAYNYETGYAVYDGSGEAITEFQNYRVYLWVEDPPTYAYRDGREDGYYLAYEEMERVFTWRDRLRLISVISAALFAIGLFYLAAVAGKDDRDSRRAGFATAIPYDLLLLITAFTAAFLFTYVNWQLWELDRHVRYAFLIAASAAMFLGIAMSTAVRIRLGSLWRDTLLCRLLQLLGKGMRLLFEVIRALPLVPKTVLLLVLLNAAELIGLYVCIRRHDVNLLLMAWMVEKIVLFLFILWYAVSLKRLQKAGEHMAAGDLDYRTDMSFLPREVKAHAANLNAVADGMNTAVEQRLKSERFKTELITNVSHDLKTPLTSIINYSDLLGRVGDDPEKTAEYAGVLHRQAERLKRLLEDLLEISKATTGTLEVELTPSDAGIMLSQAVGEYDLKFAEKELTPVVRTCEEPVIILADGRRLWRVFDNLLNNICKYAQPQTRVYLSLERRGSQAVITFRNVSAAQLDLSPDELMERFVRGDASRNSEGNGLGLSIARSMAELQKGSLAIEIDGDLFKTILTFPVVEEK